MEQIVRRLPMKHEKPLVIMPNAGYPQYVRNRVRFADNTDYFVLKMADLAAFGADIIGGCCGTNPKYIQKMAEHIDRHATRPHASETVGIRRVLRLVQHAAGLSGRIGGWSSAESRATQLSLLAPLNANDGHHR